MSTHPPNQLRSAIIIITSNLDLLSPPPFFILQSKLLFKIVNLITEFFSDYQ